MPYTGTPRTWVAGEVPTATHFNENLRDLGRAFADAWTSYTPTLTASTTNPTNWTRTGHYMQVGKLVVARIALVAGGSMTAGSGTYRVALPVTAASGQATIPHPANLYDHSTGARCLPVAMIFDPAYLEFRYPTGWPATGNQAVTNAAPWTWDASDQINVNLIYEAA